MGFYPEQSTKQADMTSHFLGSRTGRSDIFMAAVTNTKRNFNAPRAKNTGKNNCHLQQTKDFTKLDLQQTNFEKCEHLVTLFRQCSPGKLSEKGANFKQNANYFYFSATKRIFIVAHKHTLQSNEGSNDILKKLLT